MLPGGLQPTSQWAMRLYQRLGRHPYEGLALGADEQQRLVAALGTLDGLLLENHGPLVVGRTVAEAFKAAVMLEDVAKTVDIARSMGNPNEIPAEEVERGESGHRERHLPDGDQVVAPGTPHGEAAGVVDREGHAGAAADRRIADRPHGGGAGEGLHHRGPADPGHHVGDHVGLPGQLGGRTDVPQVRPSDVLTRRRRPDVLDAIP